MRKLENSPILVTSFPVKHNQILIDACYCHFKILALYWDIFAKYTELCGIVKIC